MLEKSAKKVLIITYYWPPSGGSGVQRWLKFVKYLGHFQWEPHVYTPENGEFPTLDQSLCEEIPANAVIIKKKIWEPFTIFKLFTGGKKTDSIGHGFVSDKKPGFIKRCLTKFGIWVRGNLFIPDARVFWIKPSVRFLAEYVKKNNIQIVITTGTPHSLHLIGQGLKNRCDIKWVADFRDPWTGVYYMKDLLVSSLAMSIHRKLEKKVLRSADRIISVGKHLEGNLKKLVPELQNDPKWHVIANGYDAEPVKSDPSILHEFSLVYTGMFSKEQNHAALWQAINELNQRHPDFHAAFKLHFYGKIDNSIIEAIKENGLESQLHLFQHQSLSKIKKIQEKAALLLISINHYPGEKEMLTGKLFDYLSAGRPILCIGPTDGEAASIIANTHTGVTYDRKDKEGIKKYMLDAYLAYKAQSLIIQPVSLDSYHRKNLTKQLHELLTELSSQ